MQCGQNNHKPNIEVCYGLKKTGCKMSRQPYKTSGKFHTISQTFSIGRHLVCQNPFQFCSSKTLRCVRTLRSSGSIHLGVWIDPRAACSRCSFSCRFILRFYTIKFEVELEYPVENIGAKLVRQATAKTNDLTGDGTTTSVVLAQGLNDHRRCQGASSRC
ncbi:hypothetical protein NE237_002330 [Protea cynaroides]|uniref:Uncharacterized protein n=1 Tax=Protea cynaroides TaxID=273540 RepID=A0A9Q0KV87_9MAGN|nr:hypothetical protein NE237_002330 [Protea cynaroides]